MNIYIWSRRNGFGVPFVSIDPEEDPPFDVSDSEVWVQSHTTLSGLGAEDVLRRAVGELIAKEHRLGLLLESLPIDTQAIIGPLLRRMEGLEIELGITSLRMKRQSETILRHAELLDELKVVL